MMEEVCINMYIVNTYLYVCNLSVSLVALWHVQLVKQNWTAEEVEANPAWSRIEHVPSRWYSIIQPKREENGILVIYYC